MAVGSSQEESRNPKAAAPGDITQPPDLDIRHFRSVLEEERERLLFELERIGARTARNDKVPGGRESKYADHMADIATDTQDREIDLTSHDYVEEMLEQINVALERMEVHTYGLCEVCCKPISKARLTALPYATLCIECQSKVEA